MTKLPLINATFPIDFEILSADKKHLLSGLQEAFTTQVNREMIRVKFTQTHQEIESKLSDSSSVLSLIIHIPNYFKPLTAYGKTREIKKDADKNPPQIQMAIDLVEMQEKERKLLTEYARWVQWRPRFLFFLFILILVLVGSAISYSYYLMKEDIRLRVEIRDAGAESEIAMIKLAGLLAKKTRMESELMAIEQRLAEQMENQSIAEKEAEKIKGPAMEEEQRELKKKLREAEDEKERLANQVEAFRKEKKKLEAQIATKTQVPVETIRVTFKNGQTITGKLIQSDENQVRVKIGYRPVSLKRKLIKSIEFVTSDRKVKKYER